MPLLTALSAEATALSSFAWMACRTLEWLLCPDESIALTLATTSCSACFTSAGMSL